MLAIDNTSFSFNKLSIYNSLSAYIMAQSHKTRPHKVRPHKTRPHKKRPHKTRPHKTRPHKTRPHKTRPHKTRPHKTRPHKTRPHKTRPHKENTREDTHVCVTLAISLKHQASLPHQYLKTEQSTMVHTIQHHVCEKCQHRVAITCCCCCCC